MHGSKSVSSASSSMRSIADIDRAAAEIVLVVHWIGGVHSEIRLPHGGVVSGVARPPM